MLYSYAKRVGKMLRTYYSYFKTDPRKQKRYPEQSLRQQRAKWYTATVNGSQIMQRLPRHLQDN